ncbi:hypothetical protein QN277_006712 [Acacia crassicarpa]|uniref:CCHC-type domain-containing protein n=1 Tax=Acacia crassicarpa TaxID=499986 RepID=A0AAE1M834_9FABA|nr:hypothetical protein QN277_006712 [Acacia crassicarpa]
MPRSFIRVRSLLSLKAPLLSGFWVPREGMKPIWASIRYERLQVFCYRCGRIGHDDRSCKSLSSMNGDGDENEFGSWLSTPGVKTFDDILTVCKEGWPEEVLKNVGRSSHVFRRDPFTVSSGGPSDKTPFWRGPARSNGGGGSTYIPPAMRAPVLEPLENPRASQIQSVAALKETGEELAEVSKEDDGHVKLRSKKVGVSAGGPGVENVNLVVLNGKKLMSTVGSSRMQVKHGREMIGVLAGGPGEEDVDLVDLKDNEVMSSVGPSRMQIGGINCPLLGRFFPNENGPAGLSLVGDGPRNVTSSSLAQHSSLSKSDLNINPSPCVAPCINVVECTDALIRRNSISNKGDHISSCVSQPYSVEFPSEEELNLNSIIPFNGLSPISAVSAGLKGIRIKRQLDDEGDVGKSSKCRKLDFESVGDATSDKGILGKAKKEHKRSFKSVKKFLRQSGNASRLATAGGSPPLGKIDFPESWMVVNDSEEPVQGSSQANNAGGWMRPTTGAP